MAPVQSPSLLNRFFRSFLKDLIHENKRFVPNTEIKTIFVPQYKNLSIERILEFIADKPDILDFMPDDIGK